VAEKTDIPPGVFNVVTSSDHLVGEELTLSPQVDMVSFTGSTATGRRIMEKGAPTLKRVFLELGGKSAMIVLDDADFPTVVPAGMTVCMHAGQGCAMQTRLLLPRSRYDEGVELITQAMSAVPYGDPTDPNMFMGPLVSRKQLDRVLGYIERGQEEGAKVAVGGGRPAHLPKGWFVEPTLFVDVDNSMTIAQEEIFGPVLVVIPYDDDDDAVRIANDSGYGLSGGVFSSSEDRATAVARRIRTGSIGVNGGLWYGADAPYGGYKASGIGRQNGVEGFEQYLETKSIAWVRP
jgi:aldehyde dehydrogenase (NAD+)